MTKEQSGPMYLWRSPVIGHVTLEKNELNVVIFSNIETLIQFKAKLVNFVWETVKIVLNFRIELTHIVGLNDQ